MHADAFEGANTLISSQEMEGFKQMVGQELVLVLACIDSVLLAVVLIAIGYVVIHYIIRLQIRGKFVIAFYLLATLTTVCQIVQSIAIILNWDKQSTLTRHDFT